jgi:hypothetical protein
MNSEMRNVTMRCVVKSDQRTLTYRAVSLCGLFYYKNKVRCFETSVTVNESTRHNNSEDLHLQQHSCEDFRSLHTAQQERTQNVANKYYLNNKLLQYWRYQGGKTGIFYATHFISISICFGHQPNFSSEFLTVIKVYRIIYFSADWSYYSDDIKMDEIGGSCGTYVDKRKAYRVWWENQKERARLEDLGVDGNIIHTYIYTFHGSIILSQDNRMCNKS